jgi:hypothetical protein
VGQVGEYVPDQEGDRQKQRVEAVEEPAVSGQHGARILIKCSEEKRTYLDASASFDKAFQEVAIDGEESMDEAQ